MRIPDTIVLLINKSPPPFESVTGAHPMKLLNVERHSL